MRNFLSVKYILLFAAAVPNVYASNLTIVPMYTGLAGRNLTLVESAVNTAIATFEKDLTANSAVKIPIFFTLDTNPADAGSSMAATMDISYTSYLKDLKAYKNPNSSQQLAWSHLPHGPGVGVNHNATQVQVTQALLYAIGDKKDAASLGNQNTIYLSLNPTPKATDLVPTVEHEIDEILGVGGWGSTIVSGALPTDVGPLDLYRYGIHNVLSYSNNINTSAYFSIDGGHTPLVYFNQLHNNYGGDFSDWSDKQGDGYNTPPQVQDAANNPYSTNIPMLGKNELIALTAVGWDLTAAGLSVITPVTRSELAAVPLSSTAWFMLSGLGVFAARGRKTRV